ncbi:MAG TPA: PD-(D/E)XK nuclease family protein [Polyangiaceae bacterium]|nr:PD-(D/E)XK nuclease family protein [Polyangiaceae bacterium]
MATLVESPHGEVRFRRALAWLSAQPAACPLLLLAPTLDAGNDLLRAATKQKGAVFGWAMDSLGTLAVRLSALALAARGLTLAPPLALEAVCVRVVSELKAQGKLGRLAPISERPGLPRALLRTFSELGQAGVEPEAAPADLAELYRRYRTILASLGLADRSNMLHAAIETARVATMPALGVSLCAYDLSPRTRLERQLLELLVQRSPLAFATVSSNDVAAAAVAAMLDADHARASDHDALELQALPAALRRLQAQLFSANQVLGEADESVSILSAPGESRESVEIARRILAEAERGVPFDRMAILLRSPFHYRTHLLESLRRAGVPAHFTRGAARPEPGGRALLALLECAAEGLSATRFAEYLSLGVLPDLTPDLATTPASHDVPQAPSDDETARLLSASAPNGPLPAPQPTKNLTLPRRWESLLVDAAVIGGAARWHRRLDALDRSLEKRSERASEAERLALERERGTLQGLRQFALPIIDLLGKFPEAASWGTWLSALSELTERTIDSPEAILSVLAELAIVRDVGPVNLKDVLGLLRERLGEVSPRPSANPGGKVLVASVDEARGRVFDVVFVPALAEKLFPQRVVEDPLLSDEQRELMSSELDTQSRRVASERAALALAVGAARKRVVLSYPRFESDKARPRVPSFYALEAIRAAEGRLPGFAELARRADEASQTRMGWPAPNDPAQAIDDAEYDLAQLRELLTGAAKDADGAAHYLLNASPRLRRALQFRARRWRPEWRFVDGLVEPSSLAREALVARHARLIERGFAVTALERFAACPYRFYLTTVVGLRPRPVAGAIEEMDAATRGLLIHEFLRSVSVELHEQGLFSPDTDFLHAKRVLMAAVNRAAANYRDELAPAIPRVWEDAISDIGADLVRWLQVTRETGWEPILFEYEFGRSANAATSEKAGPVMLPFGLPLQGVIDAIEQSGDCLRATDYKTGTPPETQLVIGGGRHLQPTLYALVIEQLFPDRQVTGGNAFYCTTKGQFARNEVALAEPARTAAATVHHTIESAFQDGFFPAAPADKACDVCDFRRLCGPYERERVERKAPGKLDSLLKLRSLP